MTIIIVFNKIRSITNLENFEGVCPGIGDTLLIDSIEYHVKYRIFWVNENVNNTKWCQSITLILEE